MSNIFTDVWGRTFAQGGTVNSIKDVLSRTANGDPSRAITETLWGLNHRSLANSIPINKDYYGLVFFTKPDLRLDNRSLSRFPNFSPMLTTSQNSIPRAIRAMLDFRHDTHNEESYPCGLIDPKQAFIPLLTNTITSMSGWQDVELPYYTSDAGVYGEQISFADGIAQIYRCFDITANFRNIPGDPITMFFYYWVLYAAAVFEGALSPYPDNIATNTIDYQTRIYRLVLDPSKRFVQKIASSIAFPTTVPTGTAFNFEIDQPINRNDQIHINFRAIGCEYYHDMLIHDFNRTVCIANNDMFDDQRTNAGLMVVPPEYIYLFNYAGYPRINPFTGELEWWVYQEDFKALTGEGNNTEEPNFNIDLIDAGDLAGPGR